METTEDIRNVLQAALAALNALKQINDPPPLVTFEKLEFGKKYFQKVYLSVDKSPGLVSLARLIRELFVETPKLRKPPIVENGKPKRRKSLGKRVVSNGSAQESISLETVREPPPAEEIPRIAMENAIRWSMEEFMPHLSLVYSSVYSIDSALERTIRTRIEDLLGVTIGEDSELKDGNHSLAWPSDGSLKLVRCEGPISEWEVLGSIDYHLK